MSTVQQATGVHAIRWTKAEFYHLAELGFFRGRRVELIEGNLMVLSPQQPAHSGTLGVLSVLLIQHFGTTHHVRIQLPLDLGQTTEPEPDFAIVAGPATRYLSAHPTSAELIIEVSDTTLSYDRGPKASLYAKAGIADYWIINLVNRQVEVLRDPTVDATQPFGYRYANRQVLVPPAQVTPLVLPASQIDVASLLP